MAVTQLDPKSALIVIDLQKGLMGFPVVHPITEVIARTRRLLDAFRAAGHTVVLVNCDAIAPGRTEAQRPDFSRFPEGWTDLIADLDVQPDDIQVTKKSWGAFATTGLEQTLRARGVTQVVVTGVATGSGVEATARQAYEAGFNVTLAVDAMTDTRAEAHDYSLAKVFPRLGESGTADEIIALLPGL